MALEVTIEVSPNGNAEITSLSGSRILYRAESGGGMEQFVGVSEAQLVRLRAFRTDAAPTLQDALDAALTLAEERHGPKG